MILKAKLQIVTNTRLSLNCYHLLIAPLIKEPPKTHLPDPGKNPAWYGEFWIRYPLNEKLYPMDYGHIFKARCEFCVIINRVSLKFFDEKGGKAAQSREAVTDFVEDFTAWYHSLPDPLTPKKLVFPSQINLQ